jgi:hypothetical protein
MAMSAIDGFHQFEVLHGNGAVPASAPSHLGSASVQILDPSNMAWIAGITDMVTAVE